MGPNAAAGWDGKVINVIKKAYYFEVCDFVSKLQLSLFYSLVSVDHYQSNLLCF